MKRTLIILTTTLYAFGLTAQTVQSKLESATVFRLGAELNHSAKAALSAGNNELIIEGLSASVDQNSLQITCSGGVTMTGFEFTVDYLSARTASPEEKKLQDSINYCDNEISKLNVTLETNKELKDLLQGNKLIYGTQNGLKVEELMKMMDYYKSKIIELETEKNISDKKRSALKVKIGQFTNQLKQEQLKNNKTTGRLNFKLAAPLAGTYDFSVSYYTPSAYWTPCYDLQALAADKPIKLISKAKIMQTTGIDWKKVALTLSTSTPNNGKTAPVISTWFLDYVMPVYADYSGFEASKEEFNEVGAVQNSISYRAKASAPEAPLPSSPPVYVVEGRAISEQEFMTIDKKTIVSVNVLKDESSKSLYGTDIIYVVKLKNNFVSESENQSDITYKIDLPYDVLGTGNEQSVTLRTIDLPANCKYYCVPRLDNSVYLLAGIMDWAKYNLLPGEANITYGGTYSGKSYIDPNSTKDILHLTLGNDKRIVVKREKMQDFSSTKLLGNDKKQVFTYQLTVKNNKNISVDMILKDQYPVSTDKSIVIEMLETSNAHVNEDVASLTWEFPLQAGESRMFKISYSVKYPKDKQINL